MNLARLRAAAAGARRGTSILLLAAGALVAVTVLVSAGSTGSARAAEAGGSACGDSAQASLAGSGKFGAVGAEDRDPPVVPVPAAKFDLTSFLKGRIGGAGLEWIAGLGFSWFGEVTGIKGKILANSPERQALRKLEQMKEQLDEISKRIDEVSASIADVVAELREAKYEQRLNELCTIVADQRAVFKRFAVAIRAGVRLGVILLTDPEKADVKDAGGESPREAALTARKDFYDFYNAGPRAETSIDALRAALVPKGDRKTILGLYGQVLLTHRFLTTADSEALRALYPEFANARALASWMAAEYWAGKKQAPEVIEVLQSFLTDTREAEAMLPKKIPPGVLVDLGDAGGRSETAKNANEKPMWFAPTGKDLGWLPDNVLPAPFGTIAIHEVDKTLGELNKPGKDDRQDLGKGWTAPSKAQFMGLISKDCTADPKEPRSFAGKEKCTTALKKGQNVAGYLLSQMEDNNTWQHLFCQSGPKLTCAPGAGPGQNGPHAFIWTDEAFSQTIKCGFEALPPFHTFHRVYRTYSGFRTLAEGPSQDVFPHLPGTSPYNQISDEAPALFSCDGYLKELALGRPPAPRNAFVEGVLLATRFSGDQDLSRGIDFMGQRVARDPQQPVLACAGEPTTLRGTPGNDTIRGTRRRDVIAAGAGNDVVRGLGGDDLICGGPGNDTLSGGGGGDVLDGGPGKDRLEGGRGMNKLRR
jgi:hypothetical protein